MPLSTNQNKGKLSSGAAFDTVAKAVRVPTNITMPSATSTFTSKLTKGTMKASALAALSASYKEKAALLKEEENQLAEKGARIGAAMGADPDASIAGIGTKAQQDAYLKIRGRLYAEKKAQEIMQGATNGGASAQIDSIRNGLSKTSLASTPFIDGAVPTLLGAVSAARRVDAAAAKKAAAESKASAMADLSDVFMKEMYYAKTNKDRKAALTSFVSSAKATGWKKPAINKLAYSTLVKHASNATTPEEYDEWVELMDVKSSNGRSLADEVPGGYGILLDLETRRETFIERYQQDANKASTTAYGDALTSASTLLRTGEIDPSSTDIQDVITDSDFFGNGANMTEADKERFRNSAQTLVTNKLNSNYQADNKTLSKVKDKIINGLYYGEDVEEPVKEYLELGGNQAEVSAMRANATGAAVSGISDVIAYSLKENQTMIDFIDKANMTKQLTRKQIESGVVKYFLTAGISQDAQTVLTSGDPTALVEALNNPDSPLNVATEDAFKSVMGVSDSGSIADITTAVIDKDAQASKETIKMFQQATPNYINEPNTDVSRYVTKQINTAIEQKPLSKTDAKETFMNSIPMGEQLQVEWWSAELEKKFDIEYNRKLVAERTAAVDKLVMDDMLETTNIVGTGVKTSFNSIFRATPVAAPIVVQGGEDTPVNQIINARAFPDGQNSFTVVKEEVGSGGQITRNTMSGVDAISYYLSGATSDRPGALGSDASAIFRELNNIWEEGILDEGFATLEQRVLDGTATETSPKVQLYKAVRRFIDGGYIDATDGWEPITEIGSVYEDVNYSDEAIR